MTKLGQWFDKLWNWIVYSSANPDQVSATIKWLMTAIGTLLTVAFGLGHLTYPTADITTITDQTIQFVQLFTLSLTTLGTIISLIRKIYLTLRGQNVKYSPITGKAVRPAEAPLP